jgi:hypothetical protein
LALKLLPKLLESYAMDRVHVPYAVDDPDRARNGREAIEFFKRICGARSVAVSTPGFGVGLQTHEGGLLGGGVVLGGLVVHCAVRAVELGTPYRRPQPSILWPRSEMYPPRQ